LVSQWERWPIKHQQLQQPVLLVFWNIGFPIQADVWADMGERKKNRGK
jgi:hypothetical protein